MRRTLHHNLITNPKPVNGTDGWVVFGGSSNIEFRLTANRHAYYVRNITGGGGRGIQYELADLPPGDYCYGLSVHAPSHQSGETLALINVNNTYPSAIRAVESADWRWCTGAFTLHDTGCKLMVTPPAAANTAMSVRHFIVATREDWNAMTKHDIPWFDGDGIVRGGGLIL